MYNPNNVKYRKLKGQLVLEIDKPDKFMRKIKILTPLSDIKMAIKWGSCFSVTRRFKIRVTKLSTFLDKFQRPNYQL